VCAIYWRVWRHALFMMELADVDLMGVNSKFCDGGNVLPIAFEFQVERGLTL
jgi:hypothetical protein